MKVLLDTHAVLWILLESPRLSRTVRNLIIENRPTLVVSAVSAMEITLKYRLGKLEAASPFITAGRLDIDDVDYQPLPITLAHASLAGSMPIPHKDPFDRLLLAQALIEHIPILSNEELFDGFGVQRIW